MITTTPGTTTEALLEGAPPGLAITAQLIDGDEILATVVDVTPKLDDEGDALSAYVGSFVAPANLPVMIEWLEDGVACGYELVALGGVAPGEAFPGYPTTAQLVALSSVAELTTLSEAEQDSLRDMAINAVERFTGQQFTPYVGDLAIDGTGGREVYSPKRIEELTAITVKGTSIDLTDVVVNDKRDRLYFAPLSTSYAVAAMRERAWDSREFRSGAGTVILTGSFGWSAVPSLVVAAILKEMEAQALADASQLSGIVASARRLGLQNIAQGNLRAQIGDPSAISPDAARLLANYIWIGPGGYLA